jgi:ubiquinone/menaquinone biosynthesis C-methylase UbiE
MSAFSNPEAYGRWMGRWSERLAPDFVRFAGLIEGCRVLDVGAGTGILGNTIGHRFTQVEVIGVEPSETYVTYARAHHTDNRLSFHVGDAQALPFADNSFDGSLALLILQELPDAAVAVGEMRRVTRPGGLVAACQWDFRDGFPMTSLFWHAVQECYPEAIAQRAAAQRTSPGFSDCTALAQLWSGAGLLSPETSRLEIKMEFASFDDYWAPFFSDASPTSSFAGTLPAAVLQTVARALREKLLGSGPDRPFTLKAAAVAVRGFAP